VLHKDGPDAELKRPSLKIKWIIFSAKPFSAVNPAHHTDVCIPLARFAAQVLLLPVFKIDIMLNVYLGVFDSVGFIIFVQGAPLNGG
jgi:hypothetical protein